MGFFRLYIRRAAKFVLGFFILCVILVVSFVSFRLPVTAVLYPIMLCVAVLIVITAADVVSEKKKYAALKGLKDAPCVREEDLPAPSSPKEAAYRELAVRLIDEKNRTESEAAVKTDDITEYYTAWVHQIKTPIASMNLTLQNEDTPVSRKLSGDLFRIEQYVDMVLTYLRLDNDSTDYVIRRSSLDGIVRQAVRRFAGEFIYRKITLHYDLADIEVLTDEKWLGFVVEQVLSNALKYTPEGGSVFISSPEPFVLSVRDTGIGIEAEDLPRIFERGFTGYNGRTHRRASGIGLYLCRRICSNLGHRISASSEPGNGTEILIDMGVTDRLHE